MLIEELMSQLDSGALEDPVDFSTTDDSVFIGKIQQFETLYGVKWFDFMQTFDEHKLRPKDDHERLDFAEWRMLCEKFEDQLEEGITLMASSPPEGFEYEVLGGPSNRAFSFCYT